MKRNPQHEPESELEVTAWSRAGALGRGDLFAVVSYLPGRWIDPLMAAIT